MRLYEPQTIKYIKDKFGFKFSKSLGQNFLIDKDVIDGIVEGSGVTEKDLAIEIGPGIGTLTEALSEKAGKVVCVEIDRGLAEIMRFTLGGQKNVKVVVDNILKTDINKLIEEEIGSLDRVMILGNLPYYITSQIIMKVLKAGTRAESLTVMMQKEVAERLLAEPGSRTYGAITCAVDYYSEISEIEEVPKTCFMPRPKVDSEVVRLDLRKTPRVEPKDEGLFFRVIKAAFGKRRKTLLNSLSAVVSDKDMLKETLKEAGIDEKDRAESLAIEDYARISDALTRKGY